MIEQIMQKKVMDGSVPSIFEKEKVQKIDDQTKNLFQTFYHGDKLSALEHDIERMYISEKMTKNHNY